MHIEQIYTNCLAEASYYIESEGEAVVIDPIRETEPYIKRAHERGAKIKYVMETHFHADFVSGHIDLANETGSKIVFGPTAKTEYETITATDSQVFEIGKVKIKVLHTPGHTPESSCFLLIDENGKDHAIFTGDTLFVGDVGRPDLLDGVMTKEELAGMLYDSLNNKLKPLADEVIVYPGHGPGSACGKNIGEDTWSTIGNQKKTNYAMKEMSRDAFIEVVTDGLTAPPKYFFESARVNKLGYESITDVMDRNVKSLTPPAAKTEIEKGALVLDVRKPADFASAHIPDALHVGLDGSFAVWVGTILNPSDRIVVIAPSGRERETILRLARVGFENVAGFIEGGMDAWKNEGFSVSSIQNISAEEFYNAQKSGNLTILDVRRVSEYNSGHLADVTNIPLSDLEKHYAEVPNTEPLYIHCAGGYRSMIAASMLARQGRRGLVNIDGGFGKIKETPIQIIKEWETAGA